MTPAQVAARLAEIAAAIHEGADPDQFQEELDIILGTVLVDPDENLDAAWEESYRDDDY